MAILTDRFANIGNSSRQLQHQQTVGSDKQGVDQTDILDNSDINHN